MTQELILNLLKKEPLTAKEISARLNINTKTVMNYLRRLRKKKAIEFKLIIDDDRNAKFLYSVSSENNDNGK